MKPLLFVAVLCAGLWPSAATADCVSDIVHAHQRIDALLGPLDSAEGIELDLILTQVCDPRRPGESVTDEPGRRVITTYGLSSSKHQSSYRTNTDLPPVLIELELEHLRDRRDERKTE